MHWSLARSRDRTMPTTRDTSHPRCGGLGQSGVSEHAKRRQLCCSMAVTSRHLRANLMFPTKPNWPHPWSSRPDIWASSPLHHRRRLPSDPLRKPPRHLGNLPDPRIAPCQPQIRSEGSILCHHFPRSRFRELVRIRIRVPIRVLVRSMRSGRDVARECTIEDRRSRNGGG
jgi:hypothetical protein